MTNDWPQPRSWRTDGRDYCSIIAIRTAPADNGWRSDDTTTRLRKMRRRLLRELLDELNLDWEKTCYVQDRGDNVLLVVPQAFLEAEPLITVIRGRLRKQNQELADEARLRLRVAMHTGHVCFDIAGPYGYAVDMLYAYLYAAEFGSVCGDFAFIASERVYEEVIRHSSTLIDVEMYQPVKVAGMEDRVQAWTYCPGEAARRENVDLRYLHSARA